MNPKATAGAVAEATSQTKLLSKAEVCDRVGRTFPTLWTMMRDGRFPRARELGSKPVWLEAEIESWIATLPEKKYKGDEKRSKKTAVA